MMLGEAPRVLLIGGTGFIGRHLVQACQASGMTVRIADIVPNRDSWEGMGAEYFQGDYRAQEFLDDIIRGMDMVVHLVHDTMLLNLECNMEFEFERNIQPAIRLMDACCAHDIRKLLFISSGGTVYGRSLEDQPISEDARTSPISLYGTSKLMIEKIGFLYYVQKNLPFIVARPGNAYGPGQQPFRGQGFIATAMASALQGRQLEIFGDGSVVRDYIHAHDLAYALVALLIRGQVGEAYNVGTAQGTTLRELLDGYIVPILSEAGYNLDIRYTPARGVDVPYNVLANTKIMNGTAFTPRISLDVGLRETLAWLWSAVDLKRGKHDSCIRGNPQLQP